MKRTAFVVLMVIMFVASSFAKEVEPDELFTLDGTLWDITLLTIPPYSQEGLMGFYEGNVYVDAKGVCGAQMGEPSFYVDLLATSIFISNVPCCGSCNGTVIISGILLPTGVGIMTTIGIGFVTLPQPILQVVLLFKVVEDWMPNGVE